MSSQLPTDDELVMLIKKCAGVTVDTEAMSRRPDPTFLELGVDSLGVLGIAAALENRYGIRLGAEAEQCAGPQQLRTLVGNAITEEDNDASTH